MGFLGDVLRFSVSMPIFFLSNPFVLILSLVGCILIRADEREPRLLLFLVPLALSQALLVAAGVFAGKLPDASAVNMLFLTIEALLCGGLIYWLRRSAIAAFMLALFCFGYALFADFTACMALQNTWL